MRFGQLGNRRGTTRASSQRIEEETQQMMENLARILNAAGCSFDDVFKCAVMLADMAEWADLNKVYLEYFKPERLPARSAFGASALALGATVEMEC